LEGVRELEGGDIRGLFSRAVVRAAERAQELGKKRFYVMKRGTNILTRRCSYAMLTYPLATTSGRKCKRFIVLR